MTTSPRRIAKLAPAIVLVALALPSSAFGQATRTWVSAVGDDANPCSRTSPCKTFAGASSKTNPGGEIDVLDPGGFGMVIIDKSLTIDGGVSFAGIAGVGSNSCGITVSAGGDDVVFLRHLSLSSTVFQGQF